MPAIGGRRQRGGIHGVRPAKRSFPRQRALASQQKNILSLAMESFTPLALLASGRGETRNSVHTPQQSLDHTTHTHRQPALPADDEQADVERGAPLCLRVPAICSSTFSTSLKHVPVPHVRAQERELLLGIVRNTTSPLPQEEAGPSAAFPLPAPGSSARGVREGAPRRAEAAEHDLTKFWAAWNRRRCEQRCWSAPVGAACGLAACSLGCAIAACSFGCQRCARHAQ